MGDCIDDNNFRSSSNRNLLDHRFGSSDATSFGWISNSIVHSSLIYSSTCYTCLFSIVHVTSSNACQCRRLWNWKTDRFWYGKIRCNGKHYWNRIGQRDAQHMGSVLLGPKQSRFSKLDWHTILPENLNKIVQKSIFTSFSSKVSEYSWYNLDINPCI